MQKIRMVISAIGLVLVGAGLASVPRILHSDQGEMEALNNIIYSESGQHTCWNEIRTPTGMPIVFIGLKSDDNGNIRYSFLFNFVSRPEADSENSLFNKVNVAIGNRSHFYPPMTLNVGGLVMPVSEVRKFDFIDRSIYDNSSDEEPFEWGIEVYVNSNLIDNSSVSEAKGISLHHEIIQYPLISENLKILPEERKKWKKCLDESYNDAQKYARLYANPN